MKPKAPLEYLECTAFAKWLDTQRLTFSHIASENTAKVGTRQGAITARRRHALGVRSGCPDYVILVPVPSGATELLFVEMKRRVKSLSRTSPEQAKWLGELAKVDGVRTFVAYGFDEAVNAVNALRDGRLVS